MDGGSPPTRQMSTTEIDLESVLQVRRRRLSVTTAQASQDAHRYTDVIFLKVEKSLDILKEESRCIFHGSSFGFVFVDSRRLFRGLSCPDGHLSKVHVTHQDPSWRSGRGEESRSTVGKIVHHGGIADHVVDRGLGDPAQTFLLDRGELDELRCNNEITRIHSFA